MASAKEKRKVKGILHNVAHSKNFTISTELHSKLKKTDVEFVNITIKLEAKFKDKDKVKYESKSMSSYTK